MKLIYTISLLLHGFAMVSLAENVMAFLTGEDHFRAAFAGACVISQLIVAYISLGVYKKTN